MSPSFARSSRAANCCVDHANWLGRGRIYLNDPVVDVSPANDWSAGAGLERRNRRWGIRIYPVSGFVGPEPAANASAAPES